MRRTFAVKIKDKEKARAFLEAHLAGREVNGVLVEGVMSGDAISRSWELEELLGEAVEHLNRLSGGYDEAGELSDRIEKALERDWHSE